MNGPAMKPPKGIVPNFDNPPNSNTEAIAVITICTVLVFIFTLLRAYSRLFVAKKPRIDDGNIFYCIRLLLSHLEHS